MDAGANIEMDALFEEMRRTLALRTQEHEKLVATQAMLQDQNPGLFDAEDVGVVQALVVASAASLEHYKAELDRIQDVYNQEVLALETTIREKQRILDAIDSKLHTISNTPELCTHFAAKQVSHFKKLNEVKMTLCMGLRRSAEAVLAQLQQQGEASTGAPVYPSAAGSH